ncbi:MAG: Fur family transcriptional regulator, partial [Acidimicrobiales bacterium]
MSSDLHDEVARRLGAVEQRYTASRRAIVDLLADSGRPVSVADIADLRPDLPRSSTYRHLVDLEAAGVVQRVAGHDELSRYELTEDLTEHHHHLVCVACGSVADVHPPPGLERSIASAMVHLARDQGF